MQITVTEINAALKTPEKLVNFAEKQYIDEIYSVAEKIAFDDNIKIVALAGPSGSGKTTTAHILCEKLEQLGEKTTVVSLDDFYLSNEFMPVLEDGSKDIESVNALNIELIKKCFNEIITTGKTKLPHYDFTLKKSILDHKEVDISNKGIIIVEGLHAMNPLITDIVPKKNIFKAYISVNCSILDGFGEQLLSSRQIRLVRRTLRDKIFRGASLEDTLRLWNGVIEGERKYLYCYKNTADVLIKTLHVYEPCVYRDEFLKLKNEISANNPLYNYFTRTINAIEKFEALDSFYVPQDSLIREFIGNGKYN